jgi:hypothetical protein
MIKDLLRRWSFRKSASQEPTGLLSLQAVRSAVAFISVEEQDFEACKNDILAFCREHGIKGSVFFFDFRKIEKGERLITSIATTVLRKDLNWYGRPSEEKTRIMLEGEPDLFISLLPVNTYPLEYMVRCSKARFKVGRRQLAGDVFDLVVLDPADKTLSQRESFREIVKLLETVK